MFGAVEATVAGRPVTLGRRRERALLGVLLVHLNSAVPVARLVELLWDDGARPERARPALQVHVSRLRRVLSGDRHPAGTVHFVADPAGYRLDGDPARVDLHRFRDLYDRALSATDPAHRADLLARAFALRPDPLFGGDATDGVRALLQPGTDDLVLSAAELRIAATVARGRPGEVLDDVARLVRAHPLRERPAALQVLALFRAARGAEARAAYERIRADLATELGLDPGPELRRLHEELFAPRVVPAQLPPGVAGFTGREAQLAQLDLLLGPGGPATIGSVVGAGGVGKTALAVRWAHRARARFPDGQLYADLHGYSGVPPVRPVDALTRFLRALGVPEAAIPTDVDEAAALYRSQLADRRVLVVLDNARHPDQVRPLLPGGAGSRALVTSRDRLAGLTARDGARRLALDVLGPGEAVALLGTVIGPERVAAEPDAAAELVALCGHLPLAVRITAAHLADRPEPGFPARFPAPSDTGIAGHVARLRAADRLAALEFAGDDAASVRVAFDHSHAALEPGAARLFRLLGLVPGVSFGPDAVAALADLPVDGARRALDRLAAGHLVEARGGGRYALHDLLRLYAREHADRHTVDGAAAVRRLYDWYVLAAHAVSEVLSPERLTLPVPAAVATAVPVAFADRDAAMAWAESERQNLVAAVLYPPEPVGPQAVWLLAAGLRGHLAVRRYVDDALAVALAGLAAAAHSDDPRVLSGAHQGVADAHGTLGHRRESVRHSAEALRWIRLIDLPVAEAACLLVHGRGLRIAGRLREAAEHYEAALPLLAPDEENRDGAAIARLNLAVTYRMLGRLDEGAAAGRAALAVFRELRPHLVCHAEDVLAAIALDRGAVDEAETWAEAALDGTLRFGNPYLEAFARVHVGAVHEARGRRAAAGRQYRLALEGARGIRSVEAEVSARLGLVRVAGDALGQATEAVRVGAREDYPLAEDQARTALAGALADAGLRGRAVAEARRALAGHRASGFRLAEAGTLALLSELLADHSMMDDARAICAEIGVPPPSRG
ncbi:SARP family transcriptional regulator [Longispora fulva]|nr:SARP family transcriptional regulator [Longispora fulva]